MHRTCSAKFTDNNNVGDTTDVVASIEQDLGNIKD